ncbi:hypothetical protein BAY1663_04989 [Pseudomonas sp. BAY1663]|nr:hypothetical protein BAY1663_04989 [Pseudomonas sp. BAY1663]
MLQFVEEQRALRLQAVGHPLRSRGQLRHRRIARQRIPGGQLAPRQQHERCAAHRPAAGLEPAGQARPDDAPGTAQLVQPAAAVVLQPRRQQVAFPGRGGRLEAFQLLDQRGQRLTTLHPRGTRQVLPVEQETHEIGTFHRLDLPPQTPDRVTMDARQQVPLAPLFLHRARREAPAQHVTLAFQAGQRQRHGRGRQGQRSRDQRHRQRAEAAQPRADQLHQRHLFVERRRMAGRQLQTRLERRLGIDRAQQCQALQRQPQGAVVGDRHARRTAAAGQLGEPWQPLRLFHGLGFGDAAQGIQRLVHLVGIAHLRPGLLAHRVDRLGVQRAEVVARFRVAPAPAEHRLGAPLFQRRVVEKGIGPCAEHFHRQRRRRR